MGDPSDIGALTLAVGEMRGLNVLPDFPVPDLVNVGVSDAELPANLSRACVGSTDSYNIGLGEPCANTVCSARLVHSAFMARVQSIGRLRAPKEMARIAARRVVAAMKRAVAVARSGAAIKDKRDVGSFYIYARSENKHAVSAHWLGTGPVPALVGPSAINLRPKAGFRAVRNIVYGEHSHGALQSHSGQGRALLKQRFRPVFLTESLVVRKVGGA